MRNLKSWQSSLMLLTAVAFYGCAAEDDPQGVPNVTEHSVELSSRQPHCIATTVATPRGQAVPTDVAPPAVQCFATFADAMSAATQGRVRLPASATPATVDDRTLNGGAQASSSDFVIGIEYVDINDGGASIIFHSDTTCDGFNHGVPDLRFFGWNDQISSALAFSDCNNSFHYENINFGGAMVNCGSGCTSLGPVMNDQTSSILWTN